MYKYRPLLFCVDEFLLTFLVVAGAGENSINLPLTGVAATCSCTPLTDGWRKPCLCAVGDRLLVVKLSGSSWSDSVPLPHPRMSAIKWGVGVFGGFAYTWGCHELIVAVFTMAATVVAAGWLLLFILEMIKSSSWWLASITNICKQNFSLGEIETRISSNFYTSSRTPTCCIYIFEMLNVSSLSCTDVNANNHRTIKVFSLCTQHVITEHVKTRTTQCNEHYLFTLYDYRCTCAGYITKATSAQLTDHLTFT